MGAIKSYAIHNSANIFRDINTKQKHPEKDASFFMFNLISCMNMINHKIKLVKFW